MISVKAKQKYVSTSNHRIARDDESPCTTRILSHSRQPKQHASSCHCAPARRARLDLVKAGLCVPLHIEVLDEVRNVIIVILLRAASRRALLALLDGLV